MDSGTFESEVADGLLALAAWHSSIIRAFGTAQVIPRHFSLSFLFVDFTRWSVSGIVCIGYMFRMWAPFYSISLKLTPGLELELYHNALL